MATMAVKVRNLTNTTLGWKGILIGPGGVYVVSAEEAKAMTTQNPTIFERVVEEPVEAPKPKKKRKHVRKAKNRMVKTDEEK